MTAANGVDWYAMNQHADAPQFEAGDEAYAYNQAYFQQFMPGFDQPISSVDGSQRLDGHFEVRHEDGSGTMFYDTSQFSPPRGDYQVFEDIPDIRLILVLPCFSQTRGWSQEDIEIYDDIKQKADKVVYTSQEYTRGCMHKRNRHLVDNSSACISYLTENKGGTFYTVNYAKSKGVEVINIAE